MNKEKLRQHITELRIKHSNLQQEINKLVYTHQAEEKISELKREKLRIKDEITRFEKQLKQAA